jgi:hypothetical protein
MKMDYKPGLLYIGSLFINDVNDLLKTSALILNLGYLAYQFYIFHKKNDHDKKQ